MSFGGNGGSGGSIASSSDVALNNPATGNYLGYDTTVGKWRNVAMAGTVALASYGGQETVVVNNNISGSYTIDLANANVFNLTMTGDTSFAFTGAVNGKACSFSLYIKQDSSGGWSASWPTGVRWASGVAPTLSTKANAIDILVFESLNGGTFWYGSLVGLDFRVSN
jgi:hypothetical protein